MAPHNVKFQIVIFFGSDRYQQSTDTNFPLDANVNGVSRLDQATGNSNSMRKNSGILISIVFVSDITLSCQWNSSVLMFNAGVSCRLNAPTLYSMLSK